MEDCRMGWILSRTGSFTTLGQSDFPPQLCTFERLVSKAEGVSPVTFSPLPVTKQQRRKKSHAQILQRLIKNIQNLVHFITWQSLHLRSFIFLIRPFITWLTPKWKAVNDLAILTPAHTSRYTPHNHQDNVPSLHINTNEHTTNLGLKTTFTWQL